MDGPYEETPLLEGKCFIIESYFADLDIKNFSNFLTKFGTSGHSDYCDEYKIRRDWLEYLRTTYSTLHVLPVCMY